MKVKIVFIGGLERIFTIEFLNSFDELKQIIDSSKGHKIEVFYTEEAIIPFDKILCIEKYEG